MTESACRVSDSVVVEVTESSSTEALPWCSIDGVVAGSWSARTGPGWCRMSVRGCWPIWPSRSTLTGQCSAALASLCRPRARHDPGQVLTDVAVAIADGAECISDIAALADQPGLFGPVASDTTVWRLLKQLDAERLGRGGVGAGGGAGGRLGAARRGHRRRVPRRRSRPGVQVSELRIDLDASIVIAHSDKEQAAATFKGTFGYHPMLATLDNTGEFLAARAAAGQRRRQRRRRPHRGARRRRWRRSRTQYRHGTPILVRADTAGATKAFLAHIVEPARARACRPTSRSAGGSAPAGNTMHAAIAAQPEWAWTPAIDGDGEPAEHAGGGRADRTAARAQPARAGRLPDRHAGHRAPRTPAPRRPARPIRRVDRLALHRLRHHHPSRATRPHSTPGTAPTPESRTASDAPKTPAWAGSPPASSRSTRPG